LNILLNGAGIPGILDVYAPFITNGVKHPQRRQYRKARHRGERGHRAGRRRAGQDRRFITLAMIRPH
jgi:hypothetical protein